MLGQFSSELDWVLVRLDLKPKHKHYRAGLRGLGLVPGLDPIRITGPDSRLDPISDFGSGLPMKPGS